MKLFLLSLSAIFGSYYSGFESYLASFSQEVVVNVEMPAEIVRTSTPLTVTPIPEPEIIIPEEIVPEEVVLKETLKGENDPRAIKSLFDKNYDGDNFQILEEFSRNYSISYDGDGLTLSGTLHVPHNQGKGPFPLIVLNRGFYPTIVYSNGFGFSFEQDYFARRGYVALHLDFRGYAFSENRDDYIRGRGCLGYQWAVG